jgi:CBS-domain-containing membrane protein
MPSIGAARRIRIYIGDSDQWQHQPLWRAILELLRREGLAGATVLQGAAGFGAHSRIHTRALVDLSTELPIVIEVIDRPDRLDRVMPHLEEMVTEGLITEEEVTVRAYRHRELKPLTGRLLVRDVMTETVTAVPTTATLEEVVARLSGHLFRALPVVDEDGRVAGIITTTDLIERGGLPARLRLLEPAYLPPAGPARTAAEIMTPTPVTVRADQQASAALRLLIDRHLKRLPVVDENGRLVGMLSRLDLLRVVSDGFAGMAGDEAVRRVAGQTVAEVMRTDPASVRPETPLPEVVDVLLADPLRRVLVTDADGRLLGIIGDADIVARLEPAERPGLLAWLLGRERSERQARELSQLRAADVMNRRVATIPDRATVEEAIRRSLDRRRHLLPVVDHEGRLVGVVSRAEMLAALADEY